ncbi:MAG: peptide ABC transporter substrate-binding protein, partial [Pirellulales bacterium]
VVSGPFPKGSDSSDPHSYAYDPSVKPMPYDPRLAKFLQVLVDEEFKASAAKFGDPIPEKRPLKLGVPDFELAKVAAQAIVQQWIQVGIKAEIIVLPPGKSTAPELGYDLLYVMADMWEPATDIERLIGEGGPGATDNPYIVQGLTRLRSARNWREVRDALQDLHALIDYHLPLLPLWQITDRFAYVKNLEGPQSGQITLYQTIGSWQIPQK